MFPISKSTAKNTAFAVLAVSLIASSLWATPSPTIENRINDLIGKMTLDEKISMVSGDGMETHEIPRLGIPKLKMTDGPLGVRWKKATAFPAGIAMGASFDPDLIREVAVAMGQETKALGRDMLLGPNVNISRVPVGGRSFESFGEDPFLTSTLTKPYIEGLQSQKVLASVKHFSANDQEFERMTLDVNVDERTMNEIYFPPFLTAVQSGSWTVMAAYNRVNGRYATENDELIHRVLEDRWGFKGFVVSDWHATHSTIEAANAGLDLEMPNGLYFDNKLRDAVNAKQVSMATLDDKVRRILRAIMSNGLFEQKDSDRPPESVVNSPAHQALALRTAQESIVLLKNQDGLLPLKKTVKKIAVIGPNAAVARVGGGGSALVVPFYSVSPLDGLKNRIGSAAQIRYAAGFLVPEDAQIVEPKYFSGLTGEYYPNSTLEGPPSLTREDANIDFNWAGAGKPDPSLPQQHFSIRWTGKLTPDATGTYDLAVTSDDGFRLYIDGKMVSQDWTKHGTLTTIVSVPMVAGQSYDFKLEYFQDGGWSRVQFGWFPPHEDALQAAVRIASESDVALVFVGLSDRLEGESFDRPSMDLPPTQDSLIQAIAAANPNTIVVVNSGTPVTMTQWLGSVKGVVQAWYPGQEGGNAIADILLGRVNPSAKLPVTFPKRAEDVLAAYPGKKGKLTYDEGLFVGYRHFDSHGVKPLFPFGFGLSYTTFQYKNFQVKAANDSSSDPRIEVSFDVSNSGAVKGAEIVQLYIQSDTPGVTRVFQELKAIAKPRIEPGQSASVRFSLDRGAFQYYDVASHGWKVAPGKYTIRVGSSSRDIRLSQTVELR